MRVGAQRRESQFRSGHSFRALCTTQQSCRGRGAVLSRGRRTATRASASGTQRRRRQGAGGRVWTPAQTAAACSCRRTRRICSSTWCARRLLPMSAVSRRSTADRRDRWWSAVRSDSRSWSVPCKHTCKCKEYMQPQCSQKASHTYSIQCTVKYSYEYIRVVYGAQTLIMYCASGSCVPGCRW